MTLKRRAAGIIKNVAITMMLAAAFVSVAHIFGHACGGTEDCASSCQICSALAASAADTAPNIHTVFIFIRQTPGPLVQASASAAAIRSGRGPPEI